MRRLLALSPLLVLALGLGLALPAAPARAALIAGDAIDGPSSDITSLGGVDLARDGSGGLVYVKQAGGAGHIFAARFQDGAFQPPEQLDAGLPASSQPVVAASDGGRLAVVFVSGGYVYGVVRPAGGAWSAPAPLAAGTSPALDLSINGTGYASFTTGGEVRVARLDRLTNGWTLLDQAANIDPAQPAGVGDGRSRVAISADGVGIVTWGENGHVYARKMFDEALSNAPQDLTPASFDGRTATDSELPDVDAEDDSSFAWVVFHQTFADGSSRILARRQRGTQFDPPVAVDDFSGEPVGAPRLDMNGRGVAVTMTSGVQTGQPMAAFTDRDVFTAASRYFGGSAAEPAIAPAIAENDAGLLAAVITPSGGAPEVDVRTIENGKPGSLESVLSRPELGAVQPDLGFDAAADRSSGVVVAWVQGDGADRRIVAGYLDRAPGAFAGYTSQGCCQSALPRLSWQASANLWGPVRYSVAVDGRVVGETTDTHFQLTTPLAGITHRWQVTAADPHNQMKRARSRRLTIDDVAPRLAVRYSRAQRAVTVSVRARDPSGAGHRASGVSSIVVSWGDRTRGVRGGSMLRARHRYGHAGLFPLEITASDRAGNRSRSARTVRIG
ncbi:MAG TPA: hypothetical protein VHZ75_04165 [Solirubrobacteraceae bacterium]|jgi:hypothetical protein|nr:hypothetical protein [Solirubrobacteraceae bacterium]